MLAPMLAIAVSATPAFWVSTAPRHAHLLQPVALLTQEQIESSPVELLTLRQLYAENARLDSPPTLIPSIVMLSVGGSVTLGGALLSWLALSATRAATGWDVLGWIFIDIIVLAVTAAGAVVGIIGGAMLPGKIYQRDRYAERQAEVRARIAAIRSGQAQEPLTPVEREQPQVVLEVERLNAERPGLGLPIALMSVGLGVGLLGGYYWAIEGNRSASGNDLPPIALAIGLVTAGIAMEGLGIFFLISRVRDRNEIDERIEELQRGGGSEDIVPPPPPDWVPPPAPPPPPPSAQALPPVPLFFSYAWSI